MSIPTRNGFIKTEQDAINDTEALRLKTLGYSYQRIADTLGIAKSTAYERCQRALRAIPADAVDEFRRIEGERLNVLMEVAMNKVVSGDKGALFAIDRVLAIQERAARLFVLDAPIKTQTEVVTYEGGTIEAEVAKLRRILDEHGSEPVPVDGSPSEAGADTH